MTNTTKVIAYLAPEGANVLLEHQDGRRFYAEKFSPGAKFWEENGSEPRILQGIIYKLKLIAERVGKPNTNTWKWVGGSTFEMGKTVTQVDVPAPTVKSSRAEKVKAAGKSLESVRTKTKGVVKIEPCIPETPIVTDSFGAVEDPVAKSKINTSRHENDDDDEFIPLKEIHYNHKPHSKKPMISIFASGRMTLNSFLRDIIGVGNEYGVQVSRNMRKIAVLPKGSGHKMVKNPQISCSYLVSCIELFLKDKDANKVEVELEWDDNINGYVGVIQPK